MLTVKVCAAMFRTVDIKPIEAEQLKPERLAGLQLVIAPIELPGGGVFDGPITPRLLQASHEGKEGMIRFASVFGTRELLDWLPSLPEAVLMAHDEALGDSIARDPMAASTREGRETANSIAFEAAASTGQFIHSWRNTAAIIENELRRASDPSQTIEDALSSIFDPERGLFPRFSFDVMLISGSPTPVAAPLTVWDRAVIELIDLLFVRVRRPVQCGWCGFMFPPRRKGQIYCPGTDCVGRAHRERWDRTEYRKEYLKRAKRVERGTMSKKAFDAWKLEARPQTSRRGS